MSEHEKSTTRNDLISQLVHKIDESPLQEENYLQLATLLIENNSVEEAVELLSKARVLLPDSTALSYNLAVALYYNGDYEGSLSTLTTVADGDMKFYQQALDYYKLNDAKKALAFAISISEPDTRTKELLADIWLLLNDLSTAKSILLSIDPDERNAKVWFMLGVITYGEDLEQAQSYFVLAKKKDNIKYNEMLKQYENLLTLIKGKNDD